MDSPGAWAEGDDEAAALDELVSVIFDWALLEMDDGDSDLPVLPGVIRLEHILQRLTRRAPGHDQEARDDRKFQRLGPAPATTAAGSSSRAHPPASSPPTLPPREYLAAYVGSRPEAVPARWVGTGRCAS
jgi:hypothetical protein